MYSDYDFTSRETRGTVSAAKGRNMWARERVKAHTKRCREHVTRQNLQHVTHKSDSTADDASQVSRSSDKLSVASKLLISELTVDVPLGGASTPKSSPASFSDVSITSLFVCFAPLLSAVSQTDNNWVLTRPGKSWNLRKEFSRPGKSWKVTVVMESHGKVMEFHQ